MSFVMIARGAGSAGIRTVSMRGLMAAVAACGALLLAAGAGVGYWAAQPSGGAGAPPLHAVAVERAPSQALPFALERLGALSGRLFRLESEAAHLSKRLGVQPKADPSKAPAMDGKPGSGGPMLPEAHSDLEAIDALDEHLARIEQQLAAATDAATAQRVDHMRLPTRTPVEGAQLVSGFGNREDPFNQRRAFHSGIDFAAQTGTPIRASAGGVVVYAGFRPDYGYLVEINHGNGLSTRYAHASKLLVQQGAIVAPGDEIARVGSTGRSTGPHLHYEVLRHGGHLDPRHYLAAR